MDAEQRIDDAIESVLKVCGTSLKHYTLPGNREKIRAAMRKVMSDSYIAGSNDALRVAGLIE